MNKIAIYGAGGFGREVKNIIDAHNEIKPTWEFVGFFDDGANESQLIDEKLLLGGIKELNNYDCSIDIVIAIGDPNKRMNILKLISNSNICFPNIIHPKASLASSTIKLGKGNIITEGCILTCNIDIGDFVILNLLVTVGHDSKLKNFVSVMPGVNVSGEVIINENVYVGTGAKIINLVNIGCGSIIGAGSVVSRSIPENCTAVGVPAKPIKFH
jgi:sugar O-acyltransferase (sialic acid O-acetyltransferase NeuD family)